MTGPGGQPRTVLVTGANSGIGLATALGLAGRGFRCVGTVRSAAKAALVTEAATEAGVSVETRLLDVTDRDRCAELVDELRPWGLVNNAGFGGTGAVEDVDDDDAHAHLATMVVAPARLARLCAPHMRAAGGGRIVNISSIYGRVSTPLTGWYQGSKQALEALSDALRMEVAGDGIAVILVEPGGFRTGIWDDAEGDVERRSASRYGPSYRRLLQLTRMAQPLMGDPSRCARVIGRALTTPMPRARYLVGPDARAAAAVMPFAPAAVKDRVSRLFLGL